MAEEINWEGLANRNTEASPLADYKHIERTMVEYFYCYTYKCNRIVTDKLEFCCGWCGFNKHTPICDLKHDKINKKDRRKKDQA